MRRNFTCKIWTLLMGYNKYRIYKGLNTSALLICSTNTIDKYKYKSSSAVYFFFIGLVVLGNHWHPHVDYGLHTVDRLGLARFLHLYGVYSCGAVHTECTIILQVVQVSSCFRSFIACRSCSICSVAGPSGGCPPHKLIR